MDGLSVQSARNRESQSAWDDFASHRSRVMARTKIAAEKFDRPSLCVLGAGNCNDLDLRETLKDFEHVTLTDYDLNATKEAMERQQVESENLQTVNIDLNDFPWKKLGQKKWDVVVSTCLLSQLIETAVSRTDSDLQFANQVALQTSGQHIAGMTQLLAEQGIGILVSDFVSSDTVPELLNSAEDQVTTIAQHCLTSGNFFSGTNPFPIRSRLEADFGFRVKIVPPWRWTLGKRAFLVYALEFENR